MTAAYARNWWTLVIRGLAAIVFGILTLCVPALGLVALILAFALYAIIDGIFNVVGAVTGMQRHERWGLLLAEGIVSIGVGVATFFWPGLTAFLLLLLVATWAIITGAIEFGAAIELRKMIKGEWLLGLAGICSIVFGVLILVWPGQGALAVLLLIGIYAIIFGGLLIGLGFRIRSWGLHELPPRAPQTRIPVTVG